MKGARYFCQYLNHDLPDDDPSTVGGQAGTVKEILLTGNLGGLQHLGELTLSMVDMLVRGHITDLFYSAHF